MNLPLFIAGRYLFAKKSHNVINIISAISAVGMAIGTAALIIVLSVYNGFDELVKSTLSDVEPDILIAPAKGKVFIPDGEFLDALQADPSVKELDQVLSENVFVDYEGRQGIAKAKGVGVDYERDSRLKSHVYKGDFILRKGEISQMAVGAALAYKMGINPDFLSSAKLFFPARDKSFSIANPLSSVRSVKLRPSCLFTVNQQIDEELIVLPIERMRELLGYSTEVSGVEVRLQEGISRKQVGNLVKKLEKQLGSEYVVLDRFRQNPSLYKMMRYEKAAIFLILTFIIVIIAFNIFGSLTMLIIEKRGDIATFRSLGATGGLLRKIFTLEGWLISLLGLAAGLAIGLTLSLLQQRLGLIKMPGNFLVSSYPVIVQSGDILATAVSTALIGYLIALIPVCRNIEA